MGPNYAAPPMAGRNQYPGYGGPQQSSYTVYGPQQNYGAYNENSSSFNYEENISLESPTVKKTENEAEKSPQLYPSLEIFANDDSDEEVVEPLAQEPVDLQLDEKQE
jgi:hypothetical protein